MEKFSNGFAQIIAIISVAIAAAAVLFLSFEVVPKSTQESQEQTASPSASLEISPAPTPLPTPTPSPSPTTKPSPASSPSPKPSVSAVPKTSVSSGGNYTVLTYDLGSTTVVTDTGNENDCSNNCPTKPLAQYISENGGRAGMNGTYFCPQDYNSCSSKVNSFDFAVWNNRNKKWINSSTLFWGGRGMFVFRPGSAQFFPNASSVGAPSDITGGIVNFPSLLAGGNLVLDEGLLSDKQKAKNTKSGIGTGNGKLFLVVASSASMSDLASIFKSLGANDALNLDGGGSVALYDGGYRSGPGRSLPNAVIIK